MLSLGLFTLGLLLVYRIITYIIFDYNLENTSFSEVFFLGLRFDIRFVAVLLLPGVLVSLIPGIHYFKTKAGKRISIYIFTLITFAIFVAYGYDFLCQLAFKRRLDAQTLGWILRGTPEFKTILTTTPWLVMVLLTGVGTWLSLIFAVYTHQKYKKERPKGYDKRNRIVWKIFVVLLLVFLIYGSVSPKPLSSAALKKLPTADAARFATNPFQELFGS